MSVFDGINKTAFSVVKNIMGDVAIWSPSDGSEQVQSKVLYKNPENKETLGDVDKYDYSPYKYSFEYYEGTFSNLKPLVDSGHIETVQINGLTLDVKEVTPVIDGKNFIAYCVIHE